MTAKKPNQKITKLLNDISSGDVSKAIKAVKSMEATGNASAIIPLCDLMLGGLDAKVEGAILELFSSLKDSGIKAEIMDVLDEERFLPIRQRILTTVWNMKVDFSDYIDDFVLIATQGDFLEALDCLTIIENLEGPFLEESILECQLHLKNYIEAGKSADNQKAEILSEIAIKIKDINENLNDLADYED